MEEAAKDGVNLPEKLCVDSMKYIKDFMLDKDGKWGRLQDSTFAGFVQWLHDNGLLTTKMQSRCVPPATSSLPSSSFHHIVRRVKPRPSASTQGRGHERDCFP